jgi:hypothetical protein
MFVKNISEFRNDEIIKPDFEARDFSILQGGGRRNNCFIATDDNAARSENNRFKNGNLLFHRSLKGIAIYPLIFIYFHEYIW